MLDPVMIAREWVSAAVIVAGLFFVIVGAIGLVRFPDLYTRLHGAGVTDTLGAELVLIGLIIRSPDWLTALKLAVIVLFLFITSPTATHAVANAAHAAGFKPILGRIRSGDRTTGSADLGTGTREPTGSEGAGSP